MIETAKMSDRGQIIIPKDIRQEINASGDTLFAVSSIDKDTIVMKKLDTSSLTAEFRRLRSKAKKISPHKIGEEIHAARK
ncbi:MAG TPA: AbrB/MazE/SpoVT family DNA-binding domain-containing protein [Candidatus Nanoarchaeia archaeon]|nr:AbrB/MazE/SpoVT family DNA-binding domain-containing protein [Candidatus Nanoarchaeia archaeon]